MGRALRNVLLFRKWIAVVELVLYIFMFLTIVMTAYHQFLGGGH